MEDSGFHQQDGGDAFPVRGVPVTGKPDDLCGMNLE
jgi:hypothetical protein